MKGSAMELRDLLTKTRSIRKFNNEAEIPQETLYELCTLTRLCPSSGNRQPLRFKCVSDKEDCAFISQHIRWAGLLKDWDGPSESEKPAAYILILIDKETAERAPYDSGMAAHAIIMGAVEKGLAGCMLGVIDREEIAGHFSLSKEKYYLDLVVALGEPAEQSVTEDAEESTAYYRDADNLFHVPKRKAEDIIL